VGFVVREALEITGFVGDDKGVVVREMVSVIRVIVFVQVLVVESVTCDSLFSTK
jgi:hypothetical protein